MKKVMYLTLICLMAVVLVPGCLETKEAVPATVNAATLDELGWIQSGDITRDSMIQDVGGVEVVINTATVSYIDEDLMEDINRQIQVLTGGMRSADDKSEDEQLTSLFFTIRLALPAGISIPESIIMGMVDTQIQAMAQENNIQEFYLAGEETVTIGTGESVTAKSYEGFVETGDTNGPDIKMRGVLASWTGEGTTTVVMGVMPAEDVTMQVPTDMRSSGTFTIDIDEDREFQDILTLIQNVD